MNNLKKIGIVIAVLAVVIVIAVVTRDNWLGWVNQLLGWLQDSIFGGDGRYGSALEFEDSGAGD